jgi:hypothetical protein
MMFAYHIEYTLKPLIHPLVWNFFPTLWYLAKLFYIRVLLPFKFLSPLVAVVFGVALFYTALGYLFTNVGGHLLCWLTELATHQHTHKPKFYYLDPSYLEPQRSSFLHNPTSYDYNILEYNYVRFHQSNPRWRLYLNNELLLNQLPSSSPTLRSCLGQRFKPCNSLCDSIGCDHSTPLRPIIRELPGYSYTKTVRFTGGLNNREAFVRVRADARLSF